MNLTKEMKVFLLEKNWPGREYHLQLAQYQSKRKNLGKPNEEGKEKVIFFFFFAVADWEEEKKDVNNNERCCVQ